MDTIFEAMMIIFFCAAMCIYLYRIITHTYADVKTERRNALLMGGGFALGMIKELFLPPVRWTIVFYFLGMMLVYAVLLFSCPEEKQHKKIK